MLVAVFAGPDSRSVGGFEMGCSVGGGGRYWDCCGGGVGPREKTVSLLARGSMIIDSLCAEIGQGCSKGERPRRG